MSDKCPKCGAGWYDGGGCTLDGRGPWVRWACDTVQYRDGIEESEDCLRRQLAQANAKIEGLERANRGLRHRVEELEGRPEWDSEGAAAKGGDRA